ncbi:MAG: SAM-dependent chlorinase/fluorinase, partial [Gammaproteobacteria bacterium]|nr:SAM-dependent chlorinase/fluorinase [Gammaproteobacteria bacterium]
NPKASAYLLASLIPYLPEESVILAVVDPGVGNHDRRSLIIKADKRCYVGPDNGLFNSIIKNAREVQVSEITWRPDRLSNSFHGRDLFAPVAAMLIKGKQPECKPLSVEEVVPHDWPQQMDEIIYIDHFGNVVTGLLGDNFSPDSVVKIGDHQFNYARTFSDVKKGEGFWYINANGLIEVALNQGSAAMEFGFVIGDVIQKN